jgi:hypothetical protein
MAPQEVDIFKRFVVIPECFCTITHAFRKVPGLNTLATFTLETGNLLET